MLCLLLTAVLIPQLAIAQQQAGNCDVVFTLNPQLSNFTLGGAVVAPISNPLEPANEGVLSGFQGQLVASLSAPCPTDAATLASALSSTQLATSPSTGPLNVYPWQITVKAGTLATLQWTNIAFNATLALSSATAAQLTLTAAEGYTNSTSLVTPNGDKIYLAGITGTNSTSVDISSSPSPNNTVTVTVPLFIITLPSAYNSTFGGQPLNGQTDYVVTGSLVMETTVGCSTSCGDHGRCVVDATATAGAVCQCECGWSGTACSIPSGYCPLFPTGDATSSAQCPVVPVIPPPAPPSPDTLCNSTNGGSSATQCNAFQTWNTSLSTCSCKEGWGLTPPCDACLADSACTSFYATASGNKDVSATCSTSRLYQSNTAFMSYACDLYGTGLEDAIIPSSFSVSCNTTTSSLSALGPSVPGTGGSTSNINDGSYCAVNFIMSDHLSNPITCKASLCAFHSNSSLVSCQTTSCGCKYACPDLDGVFGKIKDEPCTLDCDENGNCVFDIKDFFVTLKAPCTNHQCQVEGYAMEEGAYTYSPDKNYNPLIAAVPLMVLVTAAAVFTFYLLRNRSFFKAASLKSFVASAASGDAKSGGTAAITTSATKQQQPGEEGEDEDELHPHLHPVDTIRELAFADITSVVRLRGSGGDTRTILRGVNGVAHVGELVGILGPSGGGKTSLLSILAGAVEDQGQTVSVRGSVTLDGVAMDASEAHRIAYCAQDSTLLPTLTVEECVRYSALLRLPRGTTAQEVAATVAGVIEDLGLTKVADSLVGGSGRIRGVSGGERRRVAIAMELVTNPAVMVLDEPTSGLDSFTALNLMTTLKSVAKSGRIVILSFHQPSPSMFSLLDRCFLLAQGTCIFSGPPSAVDAHFASIGLPRSPEEGVAEHMLHCACNPSSLPHLLASVEGGHHAAILANGSDVKNGVERMTSGSEDAAENGIVGGSAAAAAAAAAAETPTTGTGTMPRRNARPPQGAGLHRELAVLFWRGLVDIVRNPTLLLLHWGMAIAMGLFVGCIFFNVGLDISGAQDRLGACFFALAFFAFTSLTTVDLIMTESRIVAREAGRGGYYSPWSYLVTKHTLDALLLRAIPIFLYSMSFYPMMGMVGAGENVALFLMVLSTFAVAIGALSMAVAVGCSTPGQASFFMNIILLTSLLVGGFFVNPASMPDWISWLHYLSAFFYAYAALTINELSSLLLNFEVEGYAAVQNVRGTTFLEVIGITPSSLTTYIIVLDCIYAAFVLLALALMWMRMPRARRLQTSK